MYKVFITNLRFHRRNIFSVPWYCSLYIDQSKSACMFSFNIRRVASIPSISQDDNRLQLPLIGYYCHYLKKSITGRDMISKINNVPVNLSCYRRQIYCCVILYQNLFYSAINLMVRL